MALFRRKKQDTTRLPELERYYEAEKRERAGLAWILALISVALAALIILGLVFGGRWLYRRITNNKPATTTVQTESGKGQDTANDEDKKGQAGGTQTPPSQGTSPSDTATPPPSTPATPNDTLANTGPESAIPAFVITTLVATALYRLRLRNNQTN
jgi:hypothetical protein